MTTITTTRTEGQAPANTPGKAAGKIEDGSEHAQVSFASFLSYWGDLSGEMAT